VSCNKVGDVVRWFAPEARLRRTLEQELAFSTDEIEVLAQVVRRTAPTWFWDINRERFIVNGSEIRSAVSDIESLIKGHAYKVADTGIR
jgi:hypothetical protein